MSRIAPGGHHLCQTSVMSETAPVRPWSARRPQNIILSVVMVALVIGLEITAVRFIQQGVGAIVPYFLILVSPILGGYYLWYWNFYSFKAPVRSYD